MYSRSSQRCCSSDSGSSSCTGVAILDRSPLPTKSFTRLHTLMFFGAGCCGRGRVARLCHLGSFCGACLQPHAQCAFSFDKSTQNELLRLLSPISSMTMLYTSKAMVAAALHASATLAYSAGKSSKCQPNCAYGSAEAASEECDSLPLPTKSMIMLRALRLWPQ